MTAVAARPMTTASALTSDDSHGHARRGKRSPTYRTWLAMRNRCSRPSHEHYAAYGGRGIRVCDSWSVSFAAFLSDMGEKPPGCSIDRIDNDGNYEPANCRWVRQVDQCRNRRSTKLTWDLAEEIRGRCEHGESRKSVAARIGVSVATVEKIVDGINWRSP